MYKVLIVDDEYMILMGLQKLIDWESLNLTIVGTAKNGQEALDFVVANPVDIVLTDVTMPLLSGIEFIKEAQRLNQQFKTIILSGYQEFDYIKEGMQLGAANYLVKPVDKIELKETLLKLINELDSQKENFQNEDLLYRSMLNDWLLNTVDYDALNRWATSSGRTIVSQNYQVVLFKIKREEQERLKKELASNSHYLFLMVSETELAVIVMDSRKDELISDLTSKMQENVLVFEGTVVATMEEVGGSYQTAKGKLDTFAFYNKDVLIVEKEKPSQFLPESFKQFTEVLALQDLSKIKAAMQEILTHFEQNVEQPKMVKQHANLLLMHLHLQFTFIENTLFQEKINEVNQAKKLKDVENILLKMLQIIELDEHLVIYSPITQQVIELVQTSYREDLNLKMIAKKLHVNVMYLGQLFKKETKKSFSTYLNDYRIKLAQNLLLHSTDPINDIALNVGYQSSGYFYKNFKKKCGVSPKEFREQYLNRK